MWMPQPPDSSFPTKESEQIPSFVRIWIITPPEVFLLFQRHFEQFSSKPETTQEEDWEHSVSLTLDSPIYEVSWFLTTLPRGPVGMVAKRRTVGRRENTERAHQYRHKKLRNRDSRRKESWRGVGTPKGTPGMRIQGTDELF